MKLIKMHGTKPKGRTRHYRYYKTAEKVNGTEINVPADVVHEQIPILLKRIHVSPKKLPQIRNLYRADIARLNGPDTEEQIAQLIQTKKRLQAEEVNILRLSITQSWTDETVRTVKGEWESKLAEVEKQIKALQQSDREFSNDLDIALLLLAQAHTLFDRLEGKAQARLLQILFKHIIIDTQGNIIHFELNPPFEYLRRLPRPPRGYKGDRKGNGSRNIHSPSYEFRCTRRHPAERCLRLQGTGVERLVRASSCSTPIQTTVIGH